jgi:hypothetical protein
MLFTEYLMDHQAGRDSIRALADFIDTFDFTYRQGDVPDNPVLRDLYWIEARNMATATEGPETKWLPLGGGNVVDELRRYGQPEVTRWAGSYDAHREMVRRLASWFTICDAWEWAMEMGERPEHGLEVYEVEFASDGHKPPIGYFIHRDNLSHDRRYEWLELVRAHDDEMQAMENRAIDRARAA